MKRRGSGTESDLSLGSCGWVGGWVFFLGEEDTWIRGTLISGLGGGGLCRSSVVWDGTRLFQDHRHPELAPGW